MRIHIKRMSDADGSTWWLLYRDGHFETPLAVLHDFELVQLADQIREQQQAAKRKR
jgi:hypothetical protein